MRGGHTPACLLILLIRLKKTQTQLWHELCIYSLKQSQEEQQTHLPRSLNKNHPGNIFTLIACEIRNSRQHWIPLPHK